MEKRGLNFDAGDIRAERLAQAVTVVRHLLNGEQVTSAGRNYRVTGQRIYPLPVQ
jgi:alkanesulfonate monooxygenase SsuD/methylene tetrahydromethanopterin reductase-like flavin-dependent oxidoreductase (luciferase family)